MPEPITPAMTVEQLLGVFPAAAAVFVTRGMSCVGCVMAAFETLAEVAETYHQELGGFLADLQRSAGLTVSGSEGERT